jgi:hypothetical protein
MAKHTQTDIIREQMQANQRIIKAASAKSGQFAVRSPLSERIRQFARGDSLSVKASPRPPRSRK